MLYIVTVVNGDYEIKSAVMVFSKDAVNGCCCCCCCVCVFVFFFVGSGASIVFQKYLPIVI